MEDQDWESHGTGAASARTVFLHGEKKRIGIGMGMEMMMMMMTTGVINHWRHRCPVTFSVHALISLSLHKPGLEHRLDLTRTIYLKP